MTQPAAQTPTLLKHFTRVIDVRRLTHLKTESFAAAIDTLTFAGRSGSHTLWQTPSPADLRHLTRFFLPNAEACFDAPDVLPAVRCRLLSPQWLAKRFGELRVTVAGSTIPFSVEKVELYLFDTGIVFLVYELSLGPAASLSSVVEFNRLAANRLHDELQLVSAGPAGDVTLAELCREVLPPDHVDLSSQNDRSYKLQTLVTLEPGTNLDDWSDELFHLRRGTKYSYERAPFGSDDGELLRPFANISIGISVESMCMAIVDTGHAFFSELPHRFKTSYFAHYLLALHQRAAVMAIGRDVACIPPIRATEPSPEVLRTLRDTRVLMTKFNLRHRFAVVSGHTNYAVVYALLMERLSVPALVDELRDKITDADELSSRLAASAEHRRRQRLEQREAARNDRESRRDRFFGRFLAIVGPTSLLFMLYATHFYREGIDLRTPGGWMPIVVTVFLTVILLTVLASRQGVRGAQVTLPLDDSDTT